MPVNAVKPAATLPQMSKEEHVIRTINPVATGLYDIGKALVNGKNLSEAYDISNQNIQTTNKRNGEALKEAHNKTVQEFKENPIKTFFTGSYVTHFIMNLFE